MKLDWLKLLLTPPGNGIFTVSTGSQYKNQLWSTYYNTTVDKKVNSSWQASLNKIWDAKDNPLIFACPSDNGGAILRGANWGPLFARTAFCETIKNFSKFDLGDIKVNPHLLSDDLLNAASLKKLSKAMYGAIKKLPVSPLSQIEYLTSMLWKNNAHRKVLFLGGDHSCSYPIVKSWCKSRKNKKFALLHFDAHTDLLSSRLGVDHCFGTWAYHVLPFLPKANHLVQVGIRTSSKDQKYWEKTIGVKQFWANDVIENSIDQISKNIVDHFEKLSVEEIYISLDVDVLDPSYLSCTGTAEAKGLSPHHLTSIVKALQNKFLISAIDLVEFAPFIRQPHIAFSQLEPDTSLLTLKTLGPILWQALSKK